MEFKKINLIYFSATGTTAQIVSAIGEGTGLKEKTVYKIIRSPQENVSIPNHELAVFGVPVFSGRVPEVAKEALAKIKGNRTPAIITCVYGNRDFDDALIELRELIKENGFVVISAAAFVAQHSIFPNVGNGRPDGNDLQIARDFGKQSLESYSPENTAELAVKGNTSYRKTKKIPLVPKTNKKKCDACGACSKQCPVQAIDKANPCKVDKQRCIACAHCISICPLQAKYFGGLLYFLAKGSFEKKNRERKEPYRVYL